jgi:putative membrane protein
MSMKVSTQVAIVVVALLHVGFLVLEMFLWDTPRGHKALRMKPVHAAATKRLAMNQGLYNGFLAAGLFWGLWLGADGVAVVQFFLGCVVVAGVFGAATVSRVIFFVQGLPAAVALVLASL